MYWEFDCLIAGVIRDDTQVVLLTARSVYASKSEGPCVEVRLSSIDEDPFSG
jgi:Holliday junction resolvase RusA-like endonuclease